MISEKSYAIALWRLKKHRVPNRYDWLHDAVVEYYEKKPPVDEIRMGNWLGLVAWRKWQDHEKTWAARKIKPWPEMDILLRPEPAVVNLEPLERLKQELTKVQMDVLDLWYRGLTIVQSARSRGRAVNADSLVRMAIKKIARSI